MRQSLSRFAHLVPEFNRRSLTLEDFYRECDERGIWVVELPLRKIRGRTSTEDGQTTIALNSLIRGTELILTAWHELGHALLHPTDSEVMLSNGRTTSRNRFERDAYAISAVALMPLQAVAGLTEEQIASVFGVSLNTAALRIEIYERCRI